MDLTSGRTTRLPGDGVSEVVSAEWTRDGQVLALKQGMDATTWTFTRNSQEVQRPGWAIAASLHLLPATIVGTIANGAKPAPQVRTEDGVVEGVTDTA